MGRLNPQNGRPLSRIVGAIGLFYFLRKNILLGVKKAKISLQNPKNQKKKKIRAKKIKTSRHFKKCTLKSLSDSKAKNKLAIL
jgi:hypothetical protein